MKYKFLLFLIFAACFFNGQVYAQKGKTSSSLTNTGHNIVFNIANANDQIVYLTIHYNDKLILKDSIKPAAKGKYIFQGAKPYDDGLYSLVSQKKKIYANFIIDRNQFFEINLDTTGDVNHFSVKNSPENEEMIRFQRKTTEAQNWADEWSKKNQSFTAANLKDSATFYQNKLIALNDTMVNFMKDLIARHPDYLFSKMQKSYLNIDVPEYKLPDGSPNVEAQSNYYKNHYWDNVDLADHRFIFIPSFEPKLKDYFTKLLYYQPTDTLTKYIDLILAKAGSDTLMYHYLVDWLSHEFETSKVIGHDAVFIHIAKTNQLAGKCYWLDDDIISKYRKFVSRREPLLIGKIAPELIIPDTTLPKDVSKWKSSYNIDKPYTMLWFYDPTCHHCQHDSKILKQVYDSLENIHQRKFEVYAIGEGDTTVWRKYVKDCQYPWINVGGNQGNIDYINYFDITSNPIMFILNSKHEIILNKNIDITQIPTFLDEYEKLQAEKAQRTAITQPTIKP